MFELIDNNGADHQFLYYWIIFILCFLYIFFPTIVIKFMWPVELTIMLEELGTSHTSVRTLPFFEMAT